MRVLVTGSRGFAGSWLVRHLNDCDDEVLELPSGLDVRDGEGVANAVQRAAPEAVCHLAAQANVATAWADPVETFSVNALGTLNVCLAAQALKRPPRVLLVSSSEVYGRVGEERMPVREDEPFAPVNPYAASKVAAEMVGLQHWLGQRLEVVRARAFNHTGPGQAQGFVVPDLARQVARVSRGEQGAVLTGDISVSRDITDVRDVVRAYRLLLVHGKPGEAYNVCRGEAVRIEDLLRRLMKLAGVDAPVRPDEALYRRADVAVHVGDCSRIRSLTGWRPEVPFEQTLAEVLAEAQAQG